MNAQGPFDQNFVISYELLAFLEWLMDNEHATFKELIRQAVARGFSFKDAAQGDSEELHYTIVEFLAMIDLLLHETLNEDETEHVLERALVPAINNIDTTMYDSSSVETSITKARAVAERHQGQKAKEVLCKELLRRWKPQKNAPVH